MGNILEIISLKKNMTNFTFGVTLMNVSFLVLIIVGVLNPVSPTVSELMILGVLNPIFSTVSEGTIVGVLNPTEEREIGVRLR